MSTKLKTGELLRLACIYAEQDRAAYLEAWRDVSDADGVKTRQETEALIKQLRAYRIRRWGKTKRDVMDERAATILQSH